MNKTYLCSNCGISGHNYKKCNMAITSYGIICIKLDSQDAYNNDVKNKLIENMKKNINNISSKPKNISYIDYEKDSFSFCLYKDNIKFLLICRKHTLGYLEFIRGHYKLNNYDNIAFLFRQMTKEEQQQINDFEFDYLWKKLWNNKNTVYDCEYKASLEKFNKLKNNKTSLSLSFYTNKINPDYETPEWGFPKGRRNKTHETNFECAVREFTEETGISKDRLDIPDEKYTFVEEFYGTNGIKYRHVYYLAFINDNINPSLDTNNISQTNEIGNIGFFNHEETNKIIRNYHIDRKKIINEIYFYFIDCILNIRRNLI